MGPLYSISSDNKFLKTPGPSTHLSSRVTPPKHLSPVVGKATKVGPHSMADQLKKKSFM
jgi:hypothetical protein